MRYSPYGFLYRKLVRPRLGPPRELEPEAPPRFAQAVGLVFAIAGVAGYATGLTLLGMAATAAALAAAFLNGAAPWTPARGPGSGGGPTALSGTQILRTPNSGMRSPIMSRRAGPCTPARR